MLREGSISRLVTAARPPWPSVLETWTGSTAASTTYAVSVATVLAAGLAIRLWMVTRPVSWQVTHNIPDDAFYYFTTARNIVEGRGATLDGETVTNGFHPLWMALMLPVFAVFDGDAAVRWAVATGAVLDVGTAAALFAVARLLLSNRSMHVRALALYALNPAAIGYSVNGLETSLSVLTLTTLLLLYTRAVVQGRVTNRGWVLIGAVSGLAVLARTDMAIVVAVVFGGYLAVLGRAGLRGAAVACSVAGLVVMPWFAWSQFNLGTLLQVSAAAGPYAARMNFEAAHGSLTLDQRLRLLLETAGGTVPRFNLGIAWYLFVPLVVATGIALVAAVASAPSTVRSLRRPVLALVPMTAGLFILLATHALGRWFVREWYFAGALPLAVLALSSAADVTTRAPAPCPRTFGHRLARFVTAGATGTVAVLLALAFGWAFHDRWLDRDGLYPWQAHMHSTARGISRDLPSEARIAAFNAGLVSYYAQRATVNLDGVMNGEAFNALRNARLAEYVQSRGIDYVVDFERSVLRDYRIFWGEPVDALLVERRCAPLFPRGTGQQDNYCIYAVVRAR